MLLTQGQIGKILTQKFNGLANVSDWIKLHRVLTSVLKKQILAAGPGGTWNPSNVQPANVHDLIFKTKIRFQCMHRLRHLQIEGQKRQTGIDCALMGIRPMKRLDDCKVRDITVRIPGEMNSLGLCDPLEHKTSKSNLMSNQAQTVTMTLGMVNTGTSSSSFTPKMVSFYKQLSREKAEAASKAEDRSWKDFALGLCGSSIVRKALHPADFDHKFHQDMEDSASERVANVAKKSKDEPGKFINVWAENAVKVIQQELFVEKSSKSFFHEMPEAMDMDGPEELSANLAAAQITTNSKWNFPKKIPRPQALHALVHLVFLTAPAISFKTEQPDTTENPGLEKLSRVIQSKGKGELVVEQDCFVVSDEQCKQTVS